MSGAITVILTEEERSVVLSALRVAADVYEEDRRHAEKISVYSAAHAFMKKRDAARELLERLSAIQSD